ncbi:hypothetical protein Bca52824_065094 [Brassica carinata]|uniref:Uncharacterized protein n=1 Tax=Brassica carinata TaxID=52824 RepID=A0A8X7U9M9_BRACI|nr:hypothetical protein Bca52824_065094 [Brassica carinata]
MSNRQGCQFEFHLKCVSAGNRKAIYYEATRASKVFQLLAAYHHDLRSDDACKAGESIETIESLWAEDLNCNKYGESFKFPDDGVIKTPSACMAMITANNLEDVEIPKYKLGTN